MFDTSFIQVFQWFIMSHARNQHICYDVAKVLSDDFVMQRCVIGGINPPIGNFGTLEGIVL